jgi:hypothetical protein
MLGGGYVLSYNLAQYPICLINFVLFFITSIYFAENGHLFQIWAPEDLTIGVHLQYSLFLGFFFFFFFLQMHF